MPVILDAVVELTSLRFAAVARVTETEWTACAVRDDLGFGLKPGDDLVVKTTICDEIRQHHQPVIFGHASAHPLFKTHHTPLQYGLESYVSVPIFRRNGDFFGTLCAIDSAPSQIDADPVKLKTICLFARLVGYQLDIVDDLSENMSRLQDAQSGHAVREEEVTHTEREIRGMLQPVVTGLYLLRASDVLGTADRAILADMEASCAAIATMLRDRLNQDGRVKA
ncbi:Sensor histidine kinase [Lysobacter dokdonensis DS-58]|uniref:Sensor histidine kinase n=1 Tax=Lysobacter dokdonensis DS-58 TaxID=1300345 RepID=A0A0A2X013_9GAMM|nr:Sensor histidine kinase [Lysobacter dokdonensis DS-58]